MRTSKIAKCTVLIALLSLAACSIQKISELTSTPGSSVDQLPVSATTTATATLGTEPARFVVSTERLFSFLEDLTAIQPYSGWRTSATEGEYQALQYIESEMNGLPFLNSLGLEPEWQDFHIYLATDMWQSQLRVTLDDNSYDIPASSLRGYLYDIEESLLLDSDSVLNDATNDPIEVEGPVVPISSEADLDQLNRSNGAGRVVFIDYALLDDNADSGGTVANIDMVLSVDPAAVILVTQNSTRQGVSHGSFANENGGFYSSRLPILQVRMEDMAAQGINGWGDLSAIDSAAVTWDQDVFSPGTSHNFIVRIPGKDPSRAMILSAHIDSVGNPGAMDDGSGSAALLEVAHVLEENQIQPEVDVYLAWFGSEELGLYGSAYFVNTHQELLDRTVADLQIDCLSRPMDGIEAFLQLAFWPGNWTDTEASAWVNFMHDHMAQQSVETHKLVMNLSSDNSMFDAYDVPNLDVVFDADDEMEELGGIWVGGHIHDPYDTVETARDSSVEFTQMAQIALEAALLPNSVDEFRSTYEPERSALFIGTHTEPSLMSPLGVTEFSMLLAQAGFDVDLIPYGQSFTLANLQSADIVFVLPIADYPSGADGENAYDESWLPVEIETLQAYVENGGMLVITNSNALTSFYGEGFVDNEDWGKMNDLSTVFGIRYTKVFKIRDSADGLTDSGLMQDVHQLYMSTGTAVVFEMETGQELAVTQLGTAAALVPYGANGGEVLALADLNVFATGWSDLNNEEFCANLIQYILDR